MFVDGKRWITEIRNAASVQVLICSNDHSRITVNRFVYLPHAKQAYLLYSRVSL